MTIQQDPHPPGTPDSLRPARRLDIPFLSGIHLLPPWVLRIALAYLILQTILCVGFDRNHPEAFLTGDRSDTRMYQVELLLASASPAQFVERLLNSGLPGDHLWHTMLFSVANHLPEPRLWVVMVQVLLNTISILVVGLMAVRLGHGDRVSGTAATLYACLPHSIVFPHTMLSESFFAPFVLYATYFTLRALQEPGRTRLFVAAGLWWVAAAMTRPEALLAPLVVGGACAMMKMAPPRRLWLFLITYAAPVGLWVATSLLLVGYTNLSNRSPEQFSRLMRSKAEYLIKTLPPDARQEEHQILQTRPTGQFTLLDLAGVYFRHPWKAVRANSLEAATLLLKFDETKFLTYLGVWEADSRWHEDLYVDPPGEFLRKYGGIVPIVVAGSLVWMGILLFSVYGVSLTWSSQEHRLIFFLVLYGLFAGLMTDATQARMRFCVDYAFVLFAAIGFFRWQNRRRLLGQR